MSSKTSNTKKLFELDDQLLSMNINKDKIGNAKFKKLIAEIKKTAQKIHDSTKVKIEKTLAKGVLDFAKFTEDEDDEDISPGVQRTFKRRVNVEKRRKEFKRGTRVQIRGTEVKGVAVPVKGYGVVQHVGPTGVIIQMDAGSGGKKITISHDKLDRAPKILERLDAGGKKAIGIDTAICEHDNCIEVFGELVCQDCKVAVGDEIQIVDEFDGLPDDFDPEEPTGLIEEEDLAFEQPPEDDSIPKMVHGFNEAFTIVDCKEDNNDKLICKRPVSFEERLMKEISDIVLEPTDFKHKVNIVIPKEVIQQIQGMKAVAEANGVDSNDNNISAAIAIARLVFFFNNEGFQNVNTAMLMLCGSGKIFESAVFLTCVAKMYKLIFPVTNLNGSITVSPETLVTNFMELFKAAPFNLKINKSKSFPTPKSKKFTKISVGPVKKPEFLKLPKVKGVDVTKRVRPSPVKKTKRRK